MDIKRLCIAALFAGTASAAVAAENTLLTDCVDLGADQEIVRAGGSQNFLLRDGDSHYLVSLRNDCGSLATTSRIAITTNGTSDRLCAKGSKIKTSRDICQISKVESIDAEQFAARKKRASR